MRRIVGISQVCTLYSANGTDEHGVYQLCHKECKMDTMVEKIQFIGIWNLLNTMVKVFRNKGNTLLPGNLRTLRMK